ncbi:MAG TPA: peptidylprolyl isomerase [Candidatus Acidoferrum sp.]|nr:peptidylprolyl isomerase [Candidatus Acidoferrum sp.]
MKGFWLIPTLAALAGAALPLRAEPTDAKLADGIKAVVNDSIVTIAEVFDFTSLAEAALRREYAGDPARYQQKLDATLNDGLEQLIERQLILHDFDVEGYRLPDSVVDELVQERIRERFGDRITLMKTLQAQGMTFEKFRQDVRDQWVVEQLRLKNMSSTKTIISPYKVETYYLAHTNDFKVEEQIKLRMIVLNKKSDDDTNTVLRAREILDEIKGGATFQEMAAVNSEGSQRSQGGDWGWVERSVLRKELADVAFALKPGQISEVIETPESCYIMQVEQTRPAHVKPLNEVRLEIEVTLRTQAQKQLEQQWIAKLKSKTFLRLF